MAASDSDFDDTGRFSGIMDNYENGYDETQFSRNDTNILTLENGKLTDSLVSESEENEVIDDGSEISDVENEDSENTFEQKVVTDLYNINS